MFKGAGINRGLELVVLGIRWEFEEGYYSRSSKELCKDDYLFGEKLPRLSYGELV